MRERAPRRRVSSAVPPWNAEVRGPCICIDSHISRFCCALVRVRFQIIGNERIKNVGKSQSCMVSKLPIIWKQTVVDLSRQRKRRGALPGTHWLHDLPRCHHTNNASTSQIENQYGQTGNQSARRKEIGSSTGVKEGRRRTV